MVKLWALDYIEWNIWINTATSGWGLVWGGFTWSPWRHNNGYYGDGPVTWQPAGYPSNTIAVVAMWPCGIEARSTNTLYTLHKVSCMLRIQISRDYKLYMYAIKTSVEVLPILCGNWLKCSSCLITSELNICSNCLYVV